MLQRGEETPHVFFGGASLSHGRVHGEVEHISAHFFDEAADERDEEIVTN